MSTLYIFFLLIISFLFDHMFQLILPTSLGGMNHFTPSVFGAGFPQIPPGS